MDITYRHESFDDYITIKNLHTSNYKRDNEGKLVDDLRLTQNFTTILSLVAEYKGEIIGHALFYPLRINKGIFKFASLFLGPISVAARFQKKGIEAELINLGIKTAEKEDYTNISVIGDANYFANFGFEQASSKNITNSFGAKDEEFLIREIKENGGLLGISGELTFTSEFDLLK